MSTLNMLMLRKTRGNIATIIIRQWRRKYELLVQPLCVATAGLHSERHFSRQTSQLAATVTVPTKPVTKSTDNNKSSTTIVVPKIQCGEPPTEARVVICGGGIMGSSVAYHLALAGWGPYIVIFDQGKVGNGTTWHASGLVGAFKQTCTQVRLAQQSIQLLMDLTDKGLPTGWRQCGSLNLARTRDRMTHFRRMKSQSV